MTAEQSGIPDHIAELPLYDALAAIAGPKLVTAIESWLVDLPLHEGCREVVAACRLYRRLGVPVSVASLANTLEVACADWEATR